MSNYAQRWLSENRTNRIHSTMKMILAKRFANSPHVHIHTLTRTHANNEALSLFATSIYGKLIKANANMDDVNMRVLSLIVFTVRVAACLLAWEKLLPSSGWTCDNMLAVAFVAFCV